MEDCKKALNNRVVAGKTADVLRGAFIEAKNKVEKAREEMEDARIERDIVLGAVRNLADGTITGIKLDVAVDFLTEKVMIYAEKDLKLVAAIHELDPLLKTITVAISYYRSKRSHGSDIRTVIGELLSLEVEVRRCRVRR